MKDKIQQLNNDILELIHKFENETGCVVHSVSTVSITIKGYGESSEKSKTTSVSCIIESK